MTREHDRNVQAFLEGMRTFGSVGGQNLVVEYRGAAGQHERYPALAAELVRLPVDVLLVGPTPAALAAKDATTTIPIGFFGETEKFWAPGNFSLATQTLVGTLGN
jgi:hypothetical protein